MSLGIFSLRGAPTPHIDLGPECAPGFPCSAAAENRQELERGLTAFVEKARQGVDPFAVPGNDPLLDQYQTSIQTLSARDPATASVLAREAAHIAQASSAARGRMSRLSRSPALHGPYYMVQAPPSMLYDYAWTGLRERIFGG